jgi:hypothetical protein
MVPAFIVNAIPKPQHRLCVFNPGLPKKSHILEEANTKNQTKPFLRPSSAPCRAGSLELTKAAADALAAHDSVFHEIEHKG